jgi:hypothetical protein
VNITKSKSPFSGALPVGDRKESQSEAPHTHGLPACGVWPTAAGWNRVVVWGFIIAPSSERRLLNCEQAVKNFFIPNRTTAAAIPRR